MRQLKLKEKYITDGEDWDLDSKYITNAYIRAEREG